MTSKLIWICLAIIMLAILVHPPDFEKPQEAAEKLASAELPFHPNAVAKPIMAVPGAIVCSNVADIQLVVHLYNNHWEETQQDAMSHGQSVLLRGPAAPAPDPKIYGCSLLAPGTPVQTEKGGLGDAVPKVTAILPDGTIVHGLTFSNMLSAQ
jgi:hypothetical protein